MASHSPVNTAPVAADANTAASVAAPPRDPFVVYQLRKPSQRGGSVVPRIRHNPGPSPANYRFARVPPASSLPAPPLPKSLDYPPRLLDWDDTLSYSSHSTRTSLLSSETAHTRSVNSAFMRFDSPSTDFLQPQTPVHVPVAVRRPFHLSPPLSHHHPPYHHHSYPSVDYLANTPGPLHARDPYEAALHTPPFYSDSAAMPSMSNLSPQLSPSQLNADTPSLSMSSSVLPHPQFQHHRLPPVLSKLDQEELIVEKLLSKSRHVTQAAHPDPVAQRKQQQQPLHPSRPPIQQEGRPSTSRNPAHSAPHHQTTRAAVAPPQLNTSSGPKQLKQSQYSHQHLQEQSRQSSLHYEYDQQQQPKAPQSSVDYGAAARLRRNLLGWVFSSSNAAPPTNSNLQSEARTNESASSYAEARRPVPDTYIHRDTSQSQTGKQLTGLARKQQANSQSFKKNASDSQETASGSRSRSPALSPSPVSAVTFSSRRSGLTTTSSHTPSSDLSNSTQHPRQRTEKLPQDPSSVAKANGVDGRRDDESQTRGGPHSGRLGPPLNARDLSDVTVGNTSMRSQNSDSNARSSDVQSSTNTRFRSSAQSPNPKSRQFMRTQTSTRSSSATKLSTSKRKEEPSFEEIIEQEKNKTSLQFASQSQANSPTEQRSRFESPSSLKVENGGLKRTSDGGASSFSPNMTTKSQFVTSAIATTASSLPMSSSFPVADSTATSSGLFSDTWRSQVSDQGQVYPSEPGNTGGRHRRSLDIHSDWSDPHATDIDVFCQCDCNCVYEEMCRRYCGAGSIRSGTQSMRSGSCASTVPGSWRGSSRRSSGAAPPQQPPASTGMVNGQLSGLYGAINMSQLVSTSKEPVASSDYTSIQQADLASRPHKFGYKSNTLSSHQGLDSSRQQHQGVRAVRDPDIASHKLLRENISSSSPQDELLAHMSAGKQIDATEYGLDRFARECNEIGARDLQFEAGYHDAGVQNGKRAVQLLESRTNAVTVSDKTVEKYDSNMREPTDDSALLLTGQRGEWHDVNAPKPSRRLSGKAIQAMLPRNRSMPSQKSSSRQQRRHSHHHANGRSSAKDHPRTGNKDSPSGASHQKRGKGRDTQAPSLPSDPAVVPPSRAGTGGDRHQHVQSRDPARHAKRKPNNCNDEVESPRRGHQTTRGQQHHRRKKRIPEPQGGGIVGAIRRFFVK